MGQILHRLVASAGILEFGIHLRGRDEYELGTHRNQEFDDEYESSLDLVRGAIEFFRVPRLYAAATDGRPPHPVGIAHEFGAGREELAEAGVEGDRLRAFDLLPSDAQCGRQILERTQEVVESVDFDLGYPVGVAAFPRRFVAPDDRVAGHRGALQYHFGHSSMDADVRQ